MYLKVFLVAVCLSFGLAPALVLAQSDEAVNSSIDDVLGDHTLYQATIEGLQKGVRDHDAEAVAKLVNYPIGVTVDGKEKTIASEKEFVADYDAIVTPDIAAAVTGQNYADLFVNYQGVMFGGGQVWINGICKDDACEKFDAKVITIQPVNNK